MKKYLIESTKSDIHIEIVFDDDDVLHSFSFGDSKTEKEHKIQTIKNMPIVLSQLKAIKSKFNTAVITEIIEFEKVPTFEEFWYRYFSGRQKDNSSKKRSEIRWNKMTKRQKINSYNHVRKYMANVSFGTVPKLAETYLNSEVWES